MSVGKDERKGIKCFGDYMNSIKGRNVRTGSMVPFVVLYLV
jgi:hypothetical protein